MRNSKSFAFSGVVMLIISAMYVAIRIPLHLEIAVAGMVSAIAYFLTYVISRSMDKHLNQMSVAAYTIDETEFFNEKKTVENLIRKGRISTLTFLLATVVMDILFIISAIETHQYGSAAIVTVCLILLVIQIGKNSKNDREAAKRLIGDKSRQLIEKLKENMPTPGKVAPLPI